MQMRHTTMEYEFESVTTTTPFGIFFFLHFLPSSPSSLSSVPFRTQQSTICKRVAGACSNGLKIRNYIFVNLSCFHITSVLHSDYCVYLATVRRRCNRVMRLYTRARALHRYPLLVCVYSGWLVLSRSCGYLSLSH